MIFEKLAFWKKPEAEKKPVIAVTPMYDPNKERYNLRGDYIQMLEGLGAVPVIMPLTAEPEILEYFLDLCDGLLLSGGNDIAPERYGQADEGMSGTVLPLRDEMELYLCRRALEMDKPMLAVCRGLQVLNIALGGTLYQDLKKQMGTELKHQVSNPADGFVHPVALAAGSPLAQLQGAETMMVNSRHHQAIRDVAPGLVVQATAPDGVIEAVYLPEKRFVWGVQWHPESVWTISEENRKIAEAFLRATR